MITENGGEARCGADPCCGQRDTKQGCIFAPKVLGTAPSPHGVGTPVAWQPRYKGDPEPWVDAADTVEEKTEAGGKGRPEACEPLSEDDYTVLLMAKAIGGLGWTDKGGQFDKLKMVEGLD